MTLVGYERPAQVHRTEIVVINSRFITTIFPVETVADTKTHLQEIRAEMPDANHHVYAFRVGYGNSVTEGMSDDGEPSGTSGPPTLAVVRGSDLGDILLVTTRYFGGTKLGTGGLVRAYTDSAKTALETLPIEKKIPKTLLGMDLPYSFYEIIKRLIEQHNGKIEDEAFTGDVGLFVEFPNDEIEEFTAQLAEVTAGQVIPLILDEE